MDQIMPHRRGGGGPRRQEPSAEHSVVTPKRQPDSHVPSAFRQHFIAMTGEFVGTVMFLYFAFGATQVANVLAPGTGGPSTSSLLYISLAFGFSLATTAWVFYRVSGGLFNPAVSGPLPAI